MPGIGFEFGAAQIGVSGIVDTSGNPATSGIANSGNGGGGNPPPPLSGCSSATNASGIKRCDASLTGNWPKPPSCFRAGSITVNGIINSGYSYCCSGKCSTVHVTFNQLYSDGTQWSVVVPCTWNTCSHQWEGFAASIPPPEECQNLQCPKMVCVKCVGGPTKDYIASGEGPTGGYTVPVPGDGWYNPSAGCGGYTIGWKSAEYTSGCCSCILSSCSTTGSLVGPCSCQPLMRTWNGCTFGGQNCNAPYRMYQVILTD